MKSRGSHRLPATETVHDDWVDGSWTVDCVCGVNFDDGEEMVNCDECGVWVHTRCSRYVKSEKLFACDKCKNKNDIRNNNDESEETEVAQLLVELPTKTLRMDNPSSHRSNVGVPPMRRPFRLWTDIPMEERVHVQGVPGGDSALFAGLSSVFGPNLWKCAGYVPKKFNFQYREFPCWDEEREEAEKRSDLENGSAADGTAGVSLPLPKENVLPNPGLTLPTVKTGGQHERNDQKNMSNGDDSNIILPNNNEKKESSLRRPIVVRYGKHKKEDGKHKKQELGNSNDRSSKKKGRNMRNEGDTTDKVVSSSAPASRISNDAKQLELFEDRSPKADNRNSKYENLTEPGNVDQSSLDPYIRYNDTGDQRNNLTSTDQGAEAHFSGNNSSVEVRSKLDDGGHKDHAKVEHSSKYCDANVTLPQYDSRGTVPLKKEVMSDGADSSNEMLGGSCKIAENDTRKSDVGTPSGAEVLSKQTLKVFHKNVLVTSLEANAEVKPEACDDHGVLIVQSSVPTDVKSDGTEYSAKQLDITAETCKLVDVAVTSNEVSEHAVQDVGKSTAPGDTRQDKAGERPKVLSGHNTESTGPEQTLGARKSLLGPKLNSNLAEELSKSSGKIYNPSESKGQRKVVVSIGKSSGSSTFMMSRSSSVDCVSANLQSRSTSSRQVGISDDNRASKRDLANAEVARSEERHEKPNKIRKDIPRSSSRTSQSNKSSHFSVSKRSSSDTKDSIIDSSSKSLPAHDNTTTPGSGESSSPLQAESASSMQDKVQGSVLPQKGGSQPGSQLMSKVNTPLAHTLATSSSPAALSDEELALLLHQELNSSPRVPRIPRIRHAGSLPQLTSPTATIMLMKRTSSGGAKDHTLSSRKKAKDGPYISREVSDDTKKANVVPSSPDHRRQDSGCTTDHRKKIEAESASTKAVRSSAVASSGLSSSTEANENTRNASDEDTGARHVHRTLPSLIAEIMSKGKRMTYEELCNAVLPHWPNLRKHNGERYAYSSHSHAVLDCLRNRSEWARLVDRGPKTSASRKKRKLDSDPPGIESEDNEDSREKAADDDRCRSFESHQDDVPKRKRNARKRRRLVLQGRGVKDVRRRRRADVVSDDDDSVSNSSEESMSSEDEVQGDRDYSAAREASASSDERDQSGG